MTHKLTLLLLFQLSVAALCAQRVTGTVTDASGVPLAGVSVSVVGKNTGTTTSAKGDYVLSQVNAQTDTLRFSFLGYETRTVAIAGRFAVDMRLNESATEIEAVQVVNIGYGTIRRNEVL